jgi:hypothetical protein
MNSFEFFQFNVLVSWPHGMREGTSAALRSWLWQFSASGIGTRITIARGVSGGILRRRLFPFTMFEPGQAFADLSLSDSGG